MSEHTPGPWQYGGAMIVARDGEHIADAIRGNPERRAANACLIAHAPDLLEAVENLIHCYETTGDLNPDALYWARLSLANAKGEVL